MRCLPGCVVSHLIVLFVSTSALFTWLFCLFLLLLHFENRNILKIVKGFKPQQIKVHITEGLQRPHYMELQLNNLTPYIIYAIKCNRNRTKKKNPTETTTKAEWKKNWGTKLNVLNWGTKLNVLQMKLPHNFTTAGIAINQVKLIKLYPKP